MKTLVLTIAIGEYYQKMGEITHPLMRAYAKRIGADFEVIMKQKISQTTPHWEKFQIHDFLNRYDRILFLDTDIIVRSDCPNLFEMVPENAMGAFDESAHYTDARVRMELAMKEYGIDVMPQWDGRYFNTGVMVISRGHGRIFEKPQQEIDNFYEQTYLNLVFVREHIQMHPLDFRFNRMHPMNAHTGEPRLSSYIVHYAGYTADNPEEVFDYIRTDIERWKKRGVA
jgi:lipopolysaccharide biosynthesis glycosyltransferase